MERTVPDKVTVNMTVSRIDGEIESVPRNSNSHVHVHRVAQVNKCFFL